MCPSLNTSVGPIISALVASGVSKYNGFKLLEPVALYDKTGSIIYVPSSKEDVFKNKEISLADKRRLMRFLMFAAAGNFGDKTEVVGKEEIPFEEFLEQVFFINKDITPAIAYALAFCTSSKSESPLHRLVKGVLSSVLYKIPPCPLCSASIRTFVPPEGMVHLLF